MNRLWKQFTDSKTTSSVTLLLDRHSFFDIGVNSVNPQNTKQSREISSAKFKKHRLNDETSFKIIESISKFAGSVVLGMA